MRKILSMAVGFILLPTAALLPLAAPAEAAPKVFLRVEGEDRNRDAGACGSGPDAPMGVWTDGFAGASGRKVLAFLNDGCWAEWDVLLPDTVVALSVAAFAHIAERDCYYYFDVYVDGRLLAQTPTYCGPFVDDGPPIVHGLPVALLAGRHTIRLVSEVVVPPLWRNEPLDYLEFETGCINLPPTLGDVDVDGLLDGLLGWNGADFPYVFQALGIEDPEGDPVSVEWVLEDGTSTAGSVLTKAFDLGTLTLAETVRLVLRVTDDPLARCAEAAARVVERLLDFLVVPDLLASLLSPLSGISCNVGQLLPSWQPYDVVAVTCTLRAGVDTRGAPANVVDKVVFRVDGEPYATVTHPTLTATYATAGVPDGFHQMDVCVTAKNDKYDRWFCSAPRSYKDIDCSNFAPDLLGIGADGLLGKLYGWNGHDYLFTAATTDPDGDPVGARWAWADGTTSSGLTVAKALTDPLAALAMRAQTLVVTVTDDPLLRCPDMPAASDTATFAFQLVGDWVARLTHLLQGVSCDAGALLPSWEAFDLIAQTCPVVGTVDLLGAPASLLEATTLRVDGTPWASSPTTSLSTTYRSADVADGPHVLDLCATAKGDKHRRQLCSEPYAYKDIDCTNLPPRLLGVTVDGLLDGTYGWNGFPYGFAAGVQDPEGDPVRVRWEWPDGSAAEGLSVEKALRDPLLSTGVRSLAYRLVLTDDPSLRCPDMLPERVVSSDFVFRLVPDWLSELLNLLPGVSCDGGALLPSWRPYEILARSCLVTGRVDLRGAPLGLLEATSLRIDGQQVAASPSTNLQAAYASAGVVDGFHELQVCATAKNDRHHRLLCSEPYAYKDIDCTNAAPELLGVAVDGLFDGSYGWNGFPYSFTARMRDPDGDPVEVRWEWPDGTTGTGPEVEKALEDPLADSHIRSVTYRVVLTDATAPRCPDMLPLASPSGPLSFRLVGDWAPRLAELRDGVSCNGGSLLGSWRPYNVLALSCPVEATVDLRGAPLSLLEALHLRVDGAAIATSWSSSIAALYRSTSVPDGDHLLDACATAKGDRHARVLCSAAYAYRDVDCGNRPPTWGGAAGDGMVDGLHGWAGLPYALAAVDLHDDDGDPLLVQWTWPDGTTTVGPSATGSLAGVGTHVVEVTLTDDPSARCPELPPLVSSGSVAFLAVPDWEVRLERPLAGRSCLGDRQVSTPAGFPDLIVGRCTVRASALAGDGATQGFAQGRLRLDGLPWFTGDSTLLEAVYDSLDHPTDRHSIDACFTVAGDKHAREFCSAPHEYLNVGL